MNPQWARQVQQLWAVALNYLEHAKALKNDTRTYEELLAPPDPGILALSADLDSAAIRLASLDELLNGGMNAVRDRAYLKDGSSGKGGLPKEYMHIFLRDAVAHAEPVEGVDKVRHTDRQAWLRKQTLADCWEGVDAARGRLQKDIRNFCRSARELNDWMETALNAWLIGMKRNPGKHR